MKFLVFIIVLAKKSQAWKDFWSKNLKMSVENRVKDRLTEIWAEDDYDKKILGVWLIFLEISKYHKTWFKGE